MTDAISFNGLCRNQLEFFSIKKDIDITLICGGSASDLDSLHKRNVGRVLHFPLYRKPNLGKDIFCLFKLFFFFIFNRFDLIVYSTPKALLLTSIAGFFAFQKNRLAVVQGRVYENEKGLKRKIFQILDKFTFLFSSKVIFVSESVMRKSIQERLLKSDKAVLLGSGSFNGVDIDKFYPIGYEKKKILRKKWNIPENDFVICTIGRICKDKGIIELKNIIEKSQFTNSKFILVGRIEDELSRHIIDNFKKDFNFSYIEYILDIHEIFQLSDLHLFLSHREGFGNVAIEAAACGTPTFAYDIVGVKDSVKEGISGKHFKFKETEEILYAIENFKNSNINPYSECAAWAKDKFQQEKVWENYLKFYLSLINKEQ
ncbi:glycosyltransferase [Acinetobacter lwoffii]|uniref:glycosyltransferase n=1 Tax=Acinetobacter lwoffii TaxID=28090 RepID=UPI0032B3308B